VDLLPDERQGTLAADARALIAETPASELRARWNANGWFDGGGESSCTDHALRFRELGRHLVAGPYVATVLAARMAGAADDIEIRDDIGAGRAVIALAVSAGAVSAGRSVTGRLRVFDAGSANHVLVVTPSGSALVASNALPPGHGVQCLDPEVQIAVVDVHEVRATLASTGAAPFLDAAVLVAALASGIAEATRDASTGFAKVREQFGRPIGAFQAVKHRCADQAILAEAAWCQTAYAALCIDAGRADAEFQVRTAKVVATDAAIRNAGANIQNHGAVGCTVESSAHLFLKRAWVLEQLAGTSREHLTALLDCPPPE
jgi:hypothetical protein